MMSIHLMLQLISAVSVCAVLFMACHICLMKRRESKKKKRKKNKMAASIPRSIQRPRDEIIYTTLKHPLVQPRDVEPPVVRFQSETRSDRSSMILDTLSISSQDLERLSKNPKFQRDPIGALKKAGANRAEIRALMSHPNFESDPLAALRKPTQIMEVQSNSRRPSVRESQSPHEVDVFNDEPYLH